MNDDGTPGYWRYEASGVLAPAIKAYLERKPLTDQHIAALRAYFRQWINAPAFQGKDVEELRQRIDGLTGKKAIDRWLDDAIKAGVDPL